MPRELECWINNETVKDLIISHLHRITVIRDYEEVVDIQVSAPDVEGLRKLIIRFQPDTQIIHHI